MTSLAGTLRGLVPPTMAWHARRVWELGPARPSPAAEIIGAGRCEDLVIRPLCRADADGWTRSMRANADRMAPWWSLGGSSLEQATGRSAFVHHLGAWESRRRRGTGLCLAIVGPDGLIGELQLWHLSPGGLTCEVGLWMAPADRRAPAVAGCFAYVFDRLFGEVGLQRIDAPVATANPLPRPFLAMGGFELEATIPKWRQLHERLVDYDLFALTPERWARAKVERGHLVPQWGPLDQGAGRPG